MSVCCYWRTHYFINVSLCCEPEEEVQIPELAEISSELQDLTAKARELGFFEGRKGGSQSMSRHLDFHWTSPLCFVNAFSLFYSVFLVIYIVLYCGQRSNKLYLKASTHCMYLTSGCLLFGLLKMTTRIWWHQRLQVRTNLFMKASWKTL